CNTGQPRLRNRPGAITVGAGSLGREDSRMTARFWTNVGRMAGLALIAAVLVPAMASAASFQRVGPAPGGDDLAVIKGVPHVAYAASDGVHVAKLTSGNVWVQVGGAIRHASGFAVSSPSLTNDANGVPWLVWLEKDSD